MKERPILFSAPMIRALLAGTKTQTRRVVKPQPVALSRYETDAEPGMVIWHGGSLCRLESPRGRSKAAAGLLNARPVACPYGTVGDRLWVRETWHPSNHVPLRTKADYLADTPEARGDGFWKWKPSIYMPRWASRITLEITGVKVERVQEISEEDAKAEGATFRDFPARYAGSVGPADGSKPMRDYTVKPDGWSMVHPVESDHCLGTPRMAFANLWSVINGPESWNANPWCWVITFRRAEAS